MRERGAVVPAVSLALREPHPFGAEGGGAGGVSGSGRGRCGLSAVARSAWRWAGRPGRHESSLGSGGLLRQCLVHLSLWFFFRPTSC